MAQIRGVFPFPFTAPATAGVPNALLLAPGERYVPPSGQYVITTGSQTILQWWDPTDTLWRNYAGPETTWQGDTDGTNYSLINLSSVVVGANITNAGSGGTNGIGPVQTGTFVTFGAPAAGGALATAQGYAIVGGSVPAPTVTQGGSGFVAPPIVCCDPPPAGGVQATFFATISAAGVITGVTQVNPGAGYLAPPNFYIIPQPQYYQGAPRWPADVPAGQPGSVITWPAPGLINPVNAWPGFPYQANLVTGTLGALLTSNPLTGSGTLTGIVMTFFGFGYTQATIPAVGFAGTSLGAAAATAIMSLSMATSSITVTSGAMTATQGVETTLGLVASTNNNNTFVPRAAHGVATAATTFNVEDPGFGFQKGPAIVGQAGTITGTQLGGVNDVSVIQAFVQ